MAIRQGRSSLASLLVLTCFRNSLYKKPFTSATVCQFISHSIETLSVDFSQTTSFALFLRFYFRTLFCQSTSPSPEASASVVAMKWTFFIALFILVNLSLSLAATKKKKNEEESKENSINYYYNELMHRPGSLITSMLHDATLPVFLVMGIASIASVLTNVSTLELFQLSN